MPSRVWDRALAWSCNFFHDYSEGVIDIEMYVAVDKKAHKWATLRIPMNCLEAAPTKNKLSHNETTRKFKAVQKWHNLAHHIPITGPDKKDSANKDKRRPASLLARRKQMRRSSS